MQSDQKQKNGWKRFLERIRPYRFNWVGRTKNGVHRWIGAPKGPSERICKNILRYGVVMSAGALMSIGAIAMHLQTRESLLWLVALGGTHGPVAILLGSWLLKMRRKLARLKSAEELAEEFGSTPETVQRLAEAHNIRARININDNDLYDPEEFLASRSLLRAAEAPVLPETLLRPAQPIAREAAPETLLRAVEPVAEAPAPVQPLTYAARTVEDDTAQQQYIGKPGSSNEPRP